jgi:hypothetical protein
LHTTTPSKITAASNFGIDTRGNRRCAHGTTLGAAMCGSTRMGSRLEVRATAKVSAAFG